MSFISNTVVEQQQNQSTLPQLVLEQLSDNISQLILLVISLQEGNAALPVNEIGSVANAVSLISSISVTLANDDYCDSSFSSIQNEIYSAAERMNNIQKKINLNLNEFNSIADRKLAWSRLIESCRDIAEESMNLLEVIYDADIKRLDILLDECKFALDSLNLSQVNQDIGIFAENVSNSVAKAIKYSTYSQLKGQEYTILPDLQNSIYSHSNKIVKLANDLIDKTNEILDENNQQSSQENENQFNHLKSILLDEINNTQKEIKSNSTRLIKKSLLPPPLQNIQENTDNNNSNNNNSNNEEKETLIDEINSSLLKATIELFRASCRGDSLAVNTISNSIEKLNQILQETIPIYDKERLKLPLTELTEEIPKYIESSLNVVKNPMNSHFISKMMENLEIIQNRLQVISLGLSNRSQVLLNTLKAKEDMLEILNDSIQENPAAIISTIKSLAKNQKDLGEIVQESDPEEIKDAIKKLSELLPKHILCAKSFLQHPNDSELKQSFMEVSQSIKIPLSKVISLMEPTPNNDTNEILVKGLSNSTTSSLIKAAESNDHDQLDIQTKELENIVANLVAIVTSEANLSDDLLVSNMIKEESNKLSTNLAKRREIIGRLKSSPSDVYIHDELELVNNEVARLSKSLSDSLKSDVSLYKSKLVTAAKEGDLGMVEYNLKDISNRVASTVYSIDCNKELIEKIDPSQFKLLSSNCEKIQEFISLLNKECKTVIPNIPNDTQRIEFLSDNILNLLSNLDNRLTSLNIQTKKSDSKLNISNNNNNNNNSNNNNNNIPEEEEKIIKEIIENEIKRDKIVELEFKEREENFSQKKLISILSDLLNNIKQGDAHHSITTMKALIAEQERIVVMANEIVSKTKSLDFKEQIDYSLGLLKASISLAINNAGKKVPESSLLLDKAIKTVKKSAIELGHLLRINNDIEILTSYQLLAQNYSNQSGPILSSHNTNNMLIKHFKDHYISLIKHDPNRLSTEKDGNQLNQINQIFEKISQYQQNANVILDRVILNDLFDLLITSDSLCKGSIQHQLNSRYHIITAFELGKNDMITLSVKKIIHHQSDLIQVANEYLISEQCDQLDQNIKQLLLNSLKTVNNSLIQQNDYLVAQGGVLEQGKVQVDKDYTTLDKLLTVIDTVKVSIEHIIKSIFTTKKPMDDSEREIVIKESVNSILPTLSLSISKLNSNPNDDKTKQMYLELLKEIIEPLESLANTPNDNNSTSIPVTPTNDSSIPKSDENIESKSKKKKIEKLVLRENEILDNLLSYSIDMDTSNVIDTSKSLVKAHQEIMLLSDQPILSTDNPNDQAIIKDIGKELTQLIPLQLSTIKQALQSTDMQQVVILHKKASHISDQVKRNLNSLNTILNPKDISAVYAKKIRNQNQNLSTMNISNDSTSPQLDKQKIQHKLSKLEKSSKLLISESENELNSITLLDSEKKQRIRDAINELELKLSKKSNDTVNSLSSTLKSYSQSPSNPTTKANFDKARQIFQDSIDKLLAETQSSSSQILNNQKDNIEKIISYAVKGNFNKVVEAAKLILIDQTKLKQQLTKDLIGADEKKKSLIQSSLYEIDTIVPEIIKSSKDLILHPTEHIKRESLENLQSRIFYPISNLQEAIHSKDDGLTLNTLISQHQSVLIKIDESLKISRDSEFQNNLSTLISIHTDICKLVSKDNSPSLEKTLKSNVSDLLSISKDYQSHLAKGTFTAAMEAEKDIAISTLKSTINQLKNRKGLESFDSQRKRYVNLKNSQQQDHLNTSTQHPHLHALSDKLSSSSTSVKNLINSIKSNNLLPITTSPTKIQKYISVHEFNDESNIIKSSLDDFKNKQQNTSSIKISKPSQPLPRRQPLKLNNTTININNNNNNNVTPTKHKLLEESFSDEARNIENLNSEVHQVNLIAKELSTFATASKTNQKQLLVLSGRNLSTLINMYCSEILKISNQCQNQPLKTKMVQGVNTLKTLSCQIKILSGVKAASSFHPDSDSQLSSIIQLLSNTIKSIDICTVTHSKTKSN